MASSPPGDVPPDEELLRQIAAGDQAAFVTLFRRRQPDVYRFARHMTASGAAAEDVTQDVFIAVMRDAGRYEPARATAAAWLCGIARNFVKRRLDAERRLQPLDDAGRLHLVPDEAAADPLGDSARAERIAGVRRMVLALPLRYREVVVLCDLQELSYADAAAAIGCAVGTVRSRLHRARALLAGRMRREAGDQVRGVKLRRRGCFA